MWLGNLVIYVQPVICLTAWIALLSAYLSPHPVGLSPLLIVRPVVSNRSDLPRAEFGFYGSCVSVDANSYPNCTSIFETNYTLDVFPNTTAKRILTPPPMTHRVLAAFSVILSIIFFLYWTVVAGMELCGIPDSTDGGWALQYIGIAAAIFAIFPFYGVSMLFRKVCRDYQLYNEWRDGGPQETDLIATLGGGFLSAWIATGALFHSASIMMVHIVKFDFKKKGKKK